MKERHEPSREDLDRLAAKANGFQRTHSENRKKRKEALKRGDIEEASRIETMSCDIAKAIARTEVDIVECALGNLENDNPKQKNAFI